jgi:Uma2 family endonuclease
MTAPPVPLLTPFTVADLASRFGPMPLHRIRFAPFPGTATEQDVIDLHDREDRLYELVDGILVEKAMGFRESSLACVLIGCLRGFVAPRQLGTVVGESGMMRLFPGLVRIPDAAFVSWDHLPNRRLPREPIPTLAPDLAVEVLSESNTAAEMDRKLHDYFRAGTRLVWFVDPEKRTVTVYTAPDRSTVLQADQTLDGGAVLPGFSLPLGQLFAELDPH